MLYVIVASYSLDTLGRVKRTVLVGNKLKKTVTEGGSVTSTLYMGGAVYQNDTLEYLDMEDRSAITFNAAGVGDITKVKEGGWKVPFKSKENIS